jgi:large subunit ribosomal protein L35
MPKLKTKKGAMKRFKITENGKVQRHKAYKSHKLTSKNAKRKRGLRKPAFVSQGEEKTVKKMLPYS